MASQPMLWGGEPDEPSRLDRPMDAATPRSATPPAASRAATPEPTPPPPRLNTTGHIAAALGVPIHRVRWVLDTRPDIRPTAYAGRARLYSAAAVARIRHELTAIEARRDAGR